MELDQEKLTRNESERSRELAQRIRRELGPCSVQVLGGVGALESALEAQFLLDMEIRILINGVE